MKVKPRRLGEEIFFILPPLCFIIGIFLTFANTLNLSGPWPHGLLLACGVASWFLAGRPIIGLIGTSLCGLIIGALISQSTLTQIEKSQPKFAQLNKTYKIEGRLRSAQQGVYGPALALDHIKILSPEHVEFKLERLTVYIPDTPQLPAHHTMITAWITLKRSQETHPIPWPIQSLRERHLPRFYGSVKSSALWQCDAWAKPRGDGLSPGNQELLGLVLDAAPAPLWQERLQPFGVGHLLSISGLHCVFVFFVLQILAWPLRRPWMRLIFTIVGLLAFAHFAGWSASVTRASLTLSAWLLIPSFGRQRSWPRLWFGLLVLGLALDPSLLLFRGFWYSFAASLGLVVGSKARTKEPSPLEHPLLQRLRPLLPIISAQLFVLPINLMFQAYTRFTDLLWNFVGILFLLILSLQGLLAFAASHIHGLIPWANGVEQKLINLLNSIPATSSFELIRWPQEPLWTLAVLTLATLALRFGAREWRWYLAISALIVFCCLGRPLTGERIVFVDVGQGLCVLHVSDQGEATFYDAGGKLPGNLRLDRLAKLFGAAKIDAAYISHLNLDHYQLLEPLKRSFPLVVSPSQVQAFRSNVMLQGYEICSIAKGEHVNWGKFKVSVLWPPADSDYFPSDNEQSLVLALQDASQWLLLTGDAGIWTEEHLELPQAQGHPILQVGHHGSKSASSSDFLERLAPADAIISCGRNNRFSHPHPIVVNRLEQHHVQLWHTSEMGSISYKDGELSYLNP